MEREGSLRRISRSLHNRLKLASGGGSSPSLADLSQAKTPSGVAEKVALVDEGGRDKGSQQRRAGANATWNSIHNAVISVFQKKDLGENELFTLNEGVRQLLKTDVGSFFTEYLQTQLLTKGTVILRDKIRFYEGQKLLDSLADTWDFFFGDVLSMLQAIFCPVQGKEPSVRQLALLHFRNIITLNLKLDEALSRPRARVPPSIVQMLLILQGVHESKGVTNDYLRLECLIQKVVSPYLGTHGLYSQDGSSNLLEKRLQRSKLGNPPVVKNLVVRSKSYNVPILSPVVEYDVDSSVGGGGGGGGGGLRRHSVCEMTSCMEESCPVADSGSDHSGRMTPTSRLQYCTDPVRCAGTSSQNPEGPRSLASARVVAQDNSAAASQSSSPETGGRGVAESLESEPGGIFLDFSQDHSAGATCSCSRQRVA
ncbi:proline-rich protein 5-like [Vanacampus margaritifer]